MTEREFKAIRHRLTMGRETHADACVLVDEIDRLHLQDALLNKRISDVQILLDKAEVRLKIPAVAAVLTRLHEEEES